MALDPNFADAYTALGVALHYAGKATESLEQFERNVVEGSVRKAGNRVRITAQLIDGSRGVLRSTVR